MPARRTRRRGRATAALAAILIMLTGLLTGCHWVGAIGDESGTTLRYQGTANSVTLPELAEALGYLGRIKLDWVGDTISGPQDIQSVATGQTDFGGAFSAAVVKLVDAGAMVTGVVNYYGYDKRTFIGFYTKDDASIHSAKDLIGKKIAVNTLGANDEAVIDDYLVRGGLTPAQIKQVQLVVLPPNNTEQAIRNGQVDVGALAGVLQDHAVATGGLRSLFSDYGLVGAYDGGQYVFRNEYLQKYPATARTFVTGVAKAIEWERTTPRARVIAEFAKIINARNRGESTADLRYWKSVGIPSHGGAVSNHDFTMWAGWLRSTGIVSGALDPHRYYTNRYNALAVNA